MLFDAVQSYQEYIERILLSHELTPGRLSAVMLVSVRLRASFDDMCIVFSSVPSISPYPISVVCECKPPPYIKCA